MADQAQKSWKALFEERIKLIGEVRKTVETGLHGAEEMLANANKQETLINFERPTTRRDRVIARKEFFGEEHERELLERYDAAVGKGIVTHLPTHMKDYVRNAERLSQTVSQEEVALNRILQQEQSYVNTAQGEVQEVVDAWKEAQKLVDKLPTKIENNKFLMTDQDVYTKLATLFGNMNSKLQAIEQHEFKAEHSEEQAQKYDQALKDQLEALRGLDMGEVRSAIQARDAARRARRRGGETT